ncbi:MAG: hypothetical protein AAF530_21445 [Pseudomonadota bacterium]
MAQVSFLKSAKTAWILGVVTVFGVSLLAYLLVGWLGIAIVGLLGLVISTNNSLHGGHSVAGADLGSANVAVFARQMEEQKRTQSSPEQKMAAEARRTKQNRIAYLINSVFVGMTLVGLWLFIREWL